MYANGFLEEKRRSPASMAAVIGLHGAALAAVMIYGTYNFVKADPHRTTLIDITDPQIPPPEPPPPHPPEPTPRQVDRVTTTDPVVPIRTDTIAAQPTPPTPAQPPAPAGPVRIAANTDIPAVPAPVRHAAIIDPNYRDALQPPYPPVEEHAQRGGTVRVRITIGANGRVTAIEQLSATSDPFWRATQRQALSRWRFRPATVDGRPIESTMLMTVTFRIPDDG